MRLGVLALQGGFAAHATALRRVGLAAEEIRTRAQLEAVDALVLPGGESTTMLRCMEPEGLLDVLRRRLGAGMPVLATCAGTILLARAVSPPQACLGVLDAAVERNAYGRQVASAVVTLEVDPTLGGPRTMEGVFIRAPRLVDLGPCVEVLARHQGDPVLVRQDSVIAATFHPELSADDRVHRLFAATLAGAAAVA